MNTIIRVHKDLQKAAKEACLYLAHYPGSYWICALRTDGRFVLTNHLDFAITNTGILRVVAGYAATTENGVTVSIHEYDGEELLRQWGR